MNLCIFSGKIFTDITKGEYGGGKTYVQFAVSVFREGGKKQDNGFYESDIFNFTAFDKTADFIMKWFEKGSHITIQSTAKVNKFQTKEGKKGQSIGFIVSKVEFADTKGKNAEKEATKKDDEFVNVADSVDSESLPFN